LKIVFQKTRGGGFDGNQERDSYIYENNNGDFYLFKAARAAKITCVKTLKLYKYYE